MVQLLDPTPTLYGKDAVEFLKRMNKPLTKEEIEHAKRIKEQRHVPL